MVCVGRNYAEHARELGNEVPAEPLIFLKPPSSIIFNNEPIVYPAISTRVDYEGELGVLIGKRVRHVSPADAWDYVAGFTVVNDVTARDLQRKDGQWTRGKGFDTFCPVLPWYVPREDVDFEELTIRTVLNGELKQQGNPRDMLFGVDAIIAFVAEFMTLEPGDLIATGTPPGVGPMLPGDTVVIEIDHVGALQNPIIQG